MSRLAQGILVFIIIFAAVAGMLVIWNPCPSRRLQDHKCGDMSLSPDEFLASPRGKEYLDKLRNEPFQGKVGLPP
jgi:hypothetical protein